MLASGVARYGSTMVGTVRHQSAGPNAWLRSHTALIRDSTTATGDLNALLALIQALASVRPSKLAGACILNFSMVAG